MGKDYPAGYSYFISKLRPAFRKKADITDPAEIEKGLMFGEFIKKGMKNKAFPRQLRLSGLITRVLTSTRTNCIVLSQKVSVFKEELLRQGKGISFAIPRNGKENFR